MDDLFRKIADLGIGAISLSREKVESKIKEWSDSGLLSPSESKKLLSELVERGEQERAELQRMIQEQVQKSLAKVGLLPNEAVETPNVDIQPERPLQEQIERLEKRIEELERKLAEEKSLTE